MAEIGLAPYAGTSFELPYGKQSKDFTNLIGVVKSTRPAAQPLIIAAHYDSAIEAPCADDNAAAVAIALSAAEILRATELTRDAVIAVFDAEEPPHFQTPNMGSIRFYEDYAVKTGVHAAVVMDLVGHDVSVPAQYLAGAGFLGLIAGCLPGLASRDVALPVIKDICFLTGTESHPDLMGVLDSVAKPESLRIVPTLNKYIGDISDQGVFRRNGIPYLFLSCGRWRHYHAPTDTPDRLNYTKMDRILNYLVDITCAVANQTFSQTPGIPPDTVDFEIRYLRQACGAFYPAVLKMLGTKELRSRQDIDALVYNLLSVGL